MKYIIALFVLFLSGGCKKFLDAKSDLTLATPSTAPDLQALIDDFGSQNRGTAAAMTGSDEYFLTTADYNQLSTVEKDLYAWKPEAIVEFDWTLFYRMILTENTILENADKLPSSPAINAIKGSALFLRAWAYWQLTQLFAGSYGSSGQGVPLRLTTDLSEKSIRATIQENYQQILDDLHAALPLLPNQPAFKTRPAKPAVYALLARTALVMGDYAGAASNADSCLSLGAVLTDFNTLDSTSSDPFALFNEEVIFHSVAYFSLATFPFYAKIDSVLTASYTVDDLRRPMFLSGNADGTFAFKGNYNGSPYSELFDGIATDELWLIKAEALARTGNASGGMSALNTLLAKRWRTGTFAPLTAADDNEALTIILTERKKELLFRGLRWSDLKRLHLGTSRGGDPSVGPLVADDLRYTLLIPPTVIRLTGMQQNPR